MEAIFQLDFDPDTPPPEYAALGSDPHVVARQPHHFHLPSFEEVMVVYEYEDSIRLPTYQTRPIRRYHPYWRIRPSPEPLERRYFNTIYDEEMVELNVPALEAPSNGHGSTPYHSAAALTGPVDRLEIPPSPQGPPPLPPVAVPLRAPVPAPVLEHDAAEDDTLNLQEQRRRRMHRLWYLIPEFVKTVMEAWEAAPQVVDRPAGAEPVPVPAAAEEHEEHLPTSTPTPPPPPPSSTQSSSSTSTSTSTLSAADGQTDN
ncbi:hypothetical protein DXG03_006104 [Asterophora parasitica]|uniref:Uncharacterized protein n=1 Tax=Asterophora parasitica TaxID=117018 RepID=A0A9P7KGU2_9AGAR|nr:hypothetical protein DXG03_006104 [Asterophora parasitica]